jgi:hypothetical protein
MNENDYSNLVCLLATEFLDSPSEDERDVLQLAMKVMPAEKREVLKRISNFGTEYVAHWNEEEV